MIMRALFCLLLAWIGLACTPDFDSVWEVKDLRILAMRSDPPEVRLESFPESGALPPVTISALVVDPRLPVGGTRRWELWACTPDEESNTCDDASRRELIQQGESSLDSISASFTLEQELLRAAIAADTFRGFGGLPIKIHLKIWDPEVAWPVEAIKRVVYDIDGIPLPSAEVGTLGGSCRAGADPCDPGLRCGAANRCSKEPNRNPEIAGLSVEGVDIPLSGLVAQSEQEIEILPRSQQDDAQPYWVYTFEGGSRELEEYLSYAFFATSGELSEATTGGKPSPFVTIKTVDYPASVWTADEPGEAMLWVVIRDDRGGTSWTSRPLQVQAP